MTKVTTTEKILDQIKDEAREDARFGTKWNPYIDGSDEHTAYETAYNAPMRFKMVRTVDGGTTLIRA